MLMMDTYIGLLVGTVISHTVNWFFFATQKLIDIVT